MYSKIAFIQLTVELVDEKWIHSADRTEMITGRQKKETFSFSDLMTDLGNNYEDFPKEAKRLIKERHQEESTLEDVKKDILDKFHSNDTGNSSKKSNKNKKINKLRLYLMVQILERARPQHQIHLFQ